MLELSQRMERLVPSEVCPEFEKKLSELSKKLPLRSLAGFESKGLITTVISRPADLRRYFRPTGDYAFVAQARLPVLIQFDLAEVVLKGRNPLTSASRTLPSLLSGWGRRGRRLSRAKGNLDKPILPWCHHPKARKPCPIAGAPMRRWGR